MNASKLVMLGYQSLGLVLEQITIVEELKVTNPPDRDWETLALFA